MSFAYVELTVSCISKRIAKLICICSVAFWNYGCDLYASGESDLVMCAAAAAGKYDFVYAVG